MLWTIILVLLLLYAVGLIGFGLAQPLIHLLVVVALVVLVIQLVQGRRV